MLEVMIALAVGFIAVSAILGLAYLSAYLDRE